MASKKISTDRSPEKIIKIKERDGLPLHIVLGCLRQATCKATPEERKAALHEINRELWKPTYVQVKEALEIKSGSISEWVLQGV